MLLLLNLCFIVVSIISLILIFEGPDPTQLTDEVVDKIKVVYETKALSGYDISRNSKANAQNKTLESLRKPLISTAGEDITLLSSVNQTDKERAEEED